MAKYVLPIMIEANTRQEAENKLLQLLKVGSEYKKVTLNDALGGIVKVCTEVADIFEHYKKNNVVAAKKRNNKLKVDYSKLQFFSSIDGRPTK